MERNNQSVNLHNRAKKWSISLFSFHFIYSMSSIIHMRSGPSINLGLVSHGADWSMKRLVYLTLPVSFNCDIYKSSAAPPMLL